MSQRSARGILQKNWMWDQPNKSICFSFVLACVFSDFRHSIFFDMGRVPTVSDPWRICAGYQFTHFQVSVLVFLIYIGICFCLEPNKFVESKRRKEAMIVDEELSFYSGFGTLDGRIFRVYTESIVWVDKFDSSGIISAFWVVFCRIFCVFSISSVL